MSFYNKNNLYKKCLEEVKTTVGIDYVFFDKVEDYGVISYSICSGELYNVVLNIYDDNNTYDLFVYKYVDTPINLEVLSKLNELNIEMRNVTFYISDNIVGAKTCRYARGYTSSIFESIQVLLAIIKERLGDLKSSIKIPNLNVQ